MAGTETVPNVKKREQEIDRSEQVLVQAYPAGFLEKLGEVLGSPVGIGRITGRGYYICGEFIVPCEVCTTGRTNIGEYRIFVNNRSGKVERVSFESESNELRTHGYNGNDGWLYFSAYAGDRYKPRGPSSEKLNFPGFAKRKTGFWKRLRC